MAREQGARSRRLSRELLLKALYQWQLTAHSIPELTAQFSALADFARCDRDFFGELLPVTIGDVPALDALISRQATRSIEQLDVVGRALLLLGLTELKVRADVPTKVVINEYVELAKRYGATDSYKFVNAVLDKMARELRPPVAAQGGA